MTEATKQILIEIARPGSTRVSIAAFYRAGIVAGQGIGSLDVIDWPVVNRTLLKRYKTSGLNYIRKLASRA